MGFMNKEQTRAAISSLTLWDDRFFSKCLDGSAECASLMLSVILGRDDLEVESARTQEWKQSIDGRSVRFDIAARGSDGSLYDIEIQKAEEGAGSRRARYYSSMMDADALDKDTGFEELPETFVIFITPGDAIGGGRPLYRIERTVEETGRRFGDGSHIVYVSSSLAERDTRLGMLMHDLACADPREMHYRELRDRVSYFKETKEGITDMENEFDRVLKNVRKESLDEGRNEGIDIGRNEGIGIGERRNSQKIARNMLAEGFPLPTIAKLSELTVEEVESIKNGIKA